MATIPRSFIPLWLCALLLVGAYLRVHGVSEYYYNPDELSNIAIAKGKDVREVIAFSKFETHPPYPAILRHFLIQISDSPDFLRGESAFFGLLCILVYYGIGKNAGGTLTGCIAAFLVTFSYGNILQSQVVRNYTMLAFFLGCTYWCYQRFIATKDARYALAYTILGLLSLMTHYSAIFMCFSVYAVSAFFMLREKQFRLLQLWTIANIIIVAYFGYLYLTEIRHNAYEQFFSIVGLTDFFTVPGYNSFVSYVCIFLLNIFLLVPFTTAYYLAGFSPSLPLELFFCVTLLFLAHSHKRVFYETLFALQLGAVITVSVYPFIGGRHVIWELPYIILPVSFLFARIGQALQTQLSKYVHNDATVVFLFVAVPLVTGFMLCESENISADKLEHPLTTVEELQRQQFLKTLTPHDVIIAAELTVPYLLPDSSVYYKNLVKAQNGQIYFSEPLYNTRILYMPHTILNGQIWNMHDLIAFFAKAGELNNVQTVWIIQTHYGNMLFREFVKCMQAQGKATLFPLIDNASLDNYSTLLKPKFVGINLNVLMHHAYSCNDEDK